ncbi:lamin tail domain-containing protein [bacterium]|nr:lamin tail domain-containing protein [bacterium]
MKKILTLLIVLAFSILPFAADRLITEHLLITEVSVSGSAGMNAEYVEIYNPTTYEIDLSNVYLTDATWSGGPTYYYMIVLGDGGGGASGDFNAKFPADASIGAGEYLVVAMAGDDFNDRFGFDADYELFDTGNAAPEMVEATAGSINDQGGITDSGEVIVLYYWDGMTDLVKDLDYFVWGDKNEAVDKTGVFIDGPDADTDVSTYANDITIDSQTAFESISGDERFYSATRTDLTESTELKNVAGNGQWGDNEMSEDLSVAFGFYLPSPGEAYDPDTLKATTYLGYAELPSSFAEVETVTFRLYQPGTPYDDIAFGTNVLEETVSVANGVDRRINIIFTGLTEGASYVAYGYRADEYVTNFYGWFTNTVYAGNHDYIYMYDRVTGFAQEQVYNTTTFNLDWDDYMDTDSGDAADSYLIKISDGNTIMNYVSATSDLDITLSEGVYEAVVLSYNLGDDDYYGASPLAEITVTHFIDKVVTLDPNTIKVYYTANLTDIGDFYIYSGYAPYAVEFSSGNNWATFVYSDFDFGWGSDYTIEQFNFVTEYGTYDETQTFTVESNFGVTGVDATDANTIVIDFSVDVDPATGADTANYGISPLLAVSAAVVSGSQVTLTVEDLAYNTDYTVTVAGVLSATDLNPINSANSGVARIDGTRITFDSITVLGIDSILLSFSGNVGALAADPANYDITPVGLTIAGVVPSGSGVTMYFTGDIPRSITYTVTANINDAVGVDIDGANDAQTFQDAVNYPKITKAEMIDEQTIKIYFNKAMNILEAGDSWYYFVYAADWSHYSYGGLAVYDHEEYSTVLHLLFPLEMNRDDYYVEGWAGYMYGDDIYIHDTKGYDISQSGQPYAVFNTNIDDLEMVYSYPSPATGSSITFANLVGSGTISIYTLSGVKIKDVDFDNTSDKKVVTLENDAEYDLKSGVYLYRVETDADGADVKTGSFAIMK